MDFWRSTIPRLNQNELQSHRTVFSAMSSWVLNISKDANLTASLITCASVWWPSWCKTFFFLCCL